MFDFNCDVAQSYGVYKNESELEVAKYASSINISAGFHAGDPMVISKALVFASENNIALGVHIGYPDIQGFGKRHMNLDKEELEALIVYQVSAIVAYAKTYDLEVEHVRCHGALKNYLMESNEALLIAIEAIKKVCPWLNLIVQTPEAKVFVEQNGLKAAYEVEFSDASSIRQIRELEVKPDTIHFKSLEDIKRAYDVLKPTPINYNRVQNQI